MILLVMPLISAVDLTKNFQYDNDPNFVNITYDQLNRIEQKNTTTDQFNYTYDETKGTLTNVTFTNSSYEYEYDNRYRIEKESKTIDGIEFNKTYTYDANNRVINIEFTSGEQLDYTYSQQGLLESINNYTNQTHTVANLPENRTYNNTLYTFFTYNDTNLRLKNIETSNIQDLSYEYDDLGNILGINDNYNNIEYNMTYDDLDRITYANRTGAVHDYEFTYTYDALGDLLTVIGTSNRTFTYTQLPIHAPDTVTVGNAPPVHYTPILNSTEGRNRSTENLTVYNINTYDWEDDNVKNIVNWYRNNTRVLLLNLPFESNSTRDYSDHINGTVSGATWESNSGYDNFGAYTFDGSDDYILLDSATELNLDVNYTIIAQVNISSSQPDTLPRILARISFAQGQGYVWYIGSSNQKMGFQVQAEDQKRIVTSDDNIPLDEFSCYAFSYNGTDSNLYINGTVKKTETWPSYAVTNATDTEKTYLGAQSPSTRPLKATMDDIVFVDRVLTDEQIEQWCLGNTNVILSNETEEGDIWHAELTPNDGVQDGQTLISNNLTVRINPNQDPPILNSTYGTNITTENLTVYNVSTFDAQGDESKNIVNWYIDGSSLQLLNLPFEGGSDATFTKDYSNNLNGTISGATWSNSSGYDGFGAYTFDGVDDYILLDNTTQLNLDANYTILTHINIDSTQTDSLPRILARITFAQGYGYLMWYQSATNTLAFQVMAEDQKRIISSTENVPLNEFSCYAYSYNGTDANIYINGTVKATQSWPSYAGTNLTSNLKTYLGSQSPSVRPLKGI
ncbi:hypothetical protein COV16_00935, partial [Candidatus Woesearchaeota archaeon CG10_big_fil_rev_8_21_14_0_10_34_8]